jgi:alpha-ribazole phosphatase
MSHALFIRHAETAMAGRFCGHSDPGLNERGRNQLILLLEQLSEETIEFIYSSDLQRAISTAEAIATNRKLPLVTRPALREIDFGQWEGRSWVEIELSNAEGAQKWMAAYPHLPAPEGETFDTFEARVLEEVNGLLARHAGPFAVVTHAGVLRVVLRRLCGCSEEMAWQRTQSYCCIVRYEMKGVHP